MNKGVKERIQTGNFSQLHIYSLASYLHNIVYIFN